MRARALFFFLTILISVQARAEQLEKPSASFAVISKPVRVRIVRSSRQGCEPGCAEWISVDGIIDSRAAQQFAIAVHSLHGRKVPIVINSPGGIDVEAMRIGTLVRALGFDVVVARTEFDSCSGSNGGCKRGDWSGAIGRLSSQPAVCYSACTFILAGGVHRSLAPGAQIGVHMISVPTSEVENWRRNYGGKARLEDVVQLSIIPEGMQRALNYFERMGISAEILGLMYCAPSTGLLFLSQDELARTRMVTGSRAGQSLIEQLAK